MLQDPVFLYVEDDSISRRVLQMLLLDLGHSNLTLFEDSSDFLARLEALPEKPNIIFLDIHMKPLDGFALLEMLRQHVDYQNAIVIALTASVMNEEVALLKKVHFSGAIAKPLKTDEFPDILDQILNGEAVWYVG